MIAMPTGTNGQERAQTEKQQMHLLFCVKIRAGTTTHFTSRQVIQKTNRLVICNCMYSKAQSILRLSAFRTLSCVI